MSGRISCDHMKTRKLFLLFSIFVFFAASCFSQPLKIEVGEANLNAYRTTDISWKGYLATTGMRDNLGLNLNISYASPTWVISPMIQAVYFFANPPSDPNFQATSVFVNMGVQKEIPVGYSMLVPSLTVGYRWEHFDVEDSYSKLNTTTENNGPTYSAGLSLLLPIFKTVDVDLGYRLVIKRNESRIGEVSQITYNIEGSEANHMLFAGFSFKLFNTDEAK